MVFDLIVVFIYAAGMLGLGWFGMRRAKTQEDYLVAGRNLGPAFYMGTIAATVLGGASTIGSVRLGYVYGISGVWLCASLGLGIIGISLFLAKPLMKLKIFTVTQVLERRYTPSARSASAVIMMAYALMIGATSTIAIGGILHTLFDIPTVYAILLGGGMVVLYSTIGGMWSLTLTDFVQFLIMTVGLVFILLPMTVNEVGGFSQLSAKLPPEFFSLTNIGTGRIITYFLIFFLGIFIGQDIWQRVFTARSVGVAQKFGFAAGVYCILFGVVCALIGMAGRLIFPDLTDANTALATLVQHSLPDGLRGLVIAAILAALMSTASAGLLAASTTAAQDLWPLVSSKSSGNESTMINRVFTFLIGLVILVIAMLVNDVLDALSLAYNLLVGGMFVPLIGAIFWKRANTQGAITSMFLGVITASYFMYQDGLDADSPIIYSLAVALISFVVVTLVTPASKKELH